MESKVIPCGLKHETTLNLDRFWAAIGLTRLDDALATRPLGTELIDAGALDHYALTRKADVPPATAHPSGRSGVLAVRVVVVPPLVGRGLRVALGRVLPVLLAPERGDIEIAPCGA
jgi:hypothetical protein